MGQPGQDARLTWGSSYAAVVAAVADLARGLTAEQLAAIVPATPAWTVRDVVAHLAGGAADNLAGRMEGAPRPAWTAVHVGERAGLDVEELLVELEGNAPAIGAFLVGRPMAGVLWDASCHLADLHEALGRGRPDESRWRPALDDARPFVLGEYADRLTAVDDYELFRGMFSRRSRPQLRAWDTSLSDAELDDLPVFGPRDDDQPVP